MLLSVKPGNRKGNKYQEKREVIITDESGEETAYTIPYGSRLKVKEGEILEPGDEITDGSVNPTIS